MVGPATIYIYYGKNGENIISTKNIRINGRSKFVITNYNF